MGESLDNKNALKTLSKLAITGKTTRTKSGFFELRCVLMVIATLNYAYPSVKGGKHVLRLWLLKN
jgi:hypothetical protein